MTLPQAVWVVVEPDGRRSLAGFAKRSYSFASGKLKLADVQQPLVTDPRVRMNAHEIVTELIDDVDLNAAKPRTDVVVTGTLALAEPRREQRIGVAAGKSARVLRAVGPRQARVTRDGRVRFDGAMPFSSLKLTALNAYGGYDELAQRELDPRPRHDGPDVFAYPRNAGGRGYYLDVERPRADGSWLPQIEDPGDPLREDSFFVSHPGAWIDAPIPGQLGWVPHTCFPRFARLVGPLLRCDPPTRPLREASFDDGKDLPDLPLLPLGKAHPGALQGASPGLACERLHGNELVILDQLLPEAPRFELSLPGEQPDISLKPPGLDTVSPKPVLQTLRIDLDRRVVSLTWCAMQPILTNVDQAFLEATEISVRWKPS